MPIDQEVAIRAVFVLADARVDQRTVRDCRKASLHVLAYTSDRLRGRRATADVGIDRRAMLIVCDLEAACFEVRHPIEDVAVVEVRPPRQMRWLEPRVARGRRGEKHLLAT